MRYVKPPLIELRQYMLAPGTRDRMIELFDGFFATAQDDLGLPILGQFRPVGDLDRLVWIRGFPDMQSRPDRLGAFYGGPVWAEFGAEAIGYVTGYDNVQLLREASPGSGIEVDLDTRPALGNLAAAGIVTATTYRLIGAPGREFAEVCGERLKTCGALLGYYVSDPTPNNFAPLPIREGEHLFTWFGTGEMSIDERDLAASFADSPERLILEPTARSVMR